MANIMLIDDDQVLLKLYSTRLTNGGHSVQTASNGEEGLTALQTFKPDVIVLDLLMPKINGFSFLEQLRNAPGTKNLKVIVFSSVANQEQIARLQLLGIETFLNKIDTTPTQLVEIIEQQLAPSPQ